MRLKHDLPLELLKALNAVLVTIPFAVCWIVVYSGILWKAPFYAKGNYVIVFLFFVVYCVLGKTYDAFSISLNPVSEMVYSQFLTALISDFFLYIVTFLLMRRMPAVMPMLACLTAQTVIAVVWSVLARKWYFSTFPPKKTLIIYDMLEGMENLISAYGMDKKFDVVASCSAQDCLDHDLDDITPEIETVFMCGVHSHDRNIILKYCVDQGITVYLLPRIGDIIMSGAQKMHMFHLPVMRAERYNPSIEHTVIKRLFDIVVSGLAIVVFSPFMLITAIAIRSDGGPALYKQRRLTKDGKEFDILKFRSMRVDAEKDGVARLSSGDNDDRITKVGKIIRKIRFDELPQLFNILKGDMSVVGPRPERPEIAAEYEKVIPEFRLRLQAKAGLTGYAQVYGKYNTTPYDKLQMDLMYIAHPSLIEDLKICFATVKILFMSDSTEGVTEGQITAIRNIEEDDE